ncbi:MAG: hypothetical protein QXY76_07835, partial [Nitrososphaeria archaeon]
LNLDGEQAVKAGEIAEKEGLYLIDGIIYSYADDKTHLLTGDKHFKGKQYAYLIHSKKKNQNLLLEIKH